MNDFGHYCPNIKLVLYMCARRCPKHLVSLLPEETEESSSQLLSLYHREHTDKVHLSVAQQLLSV